MIFKDYISSLYELRLNYPKSNPLNFVAKLLMNSLSGGFCMMENFTKTDFMTLKKYSKVESKIVDNILDVLDLGNSYMVTTFSEKQYLDSPLGSHNYHSNVNVAISLNIAALAIIKLYTAIKFLIYNDYKLYYKDTDSLYVNKPLPEDMVFKYRAR